MVDFEEKIWRWSNLAAKEQKFHADCKIIVQQVTSGMGYSSANFRVSINEPNRELKMYAKIANIPEDLRKTSYSRLFADELYFYKVVAEKFKELENQHNLEEKDRLTLPKFFGGDPTPREETILLEDLCQKGFAIHGQDILFDWEYASKVVEQLAKYHALSFVYGVECPSEFGKMLESKPYHVFDSALMKELGFEQTVPLAVRALEDDGDLQQRVQDYLATSDRHAELIKLYKSAKPRVLAHGDFKTNNIMHRYHEGQLEVVIVDYQNIHAGSPVTDLLYFVMLGSDEAFRARSLCALRDHYHTQLENALARFSVGVEDVYPKSVFEEEWEQALPIGLAIALMILPFVLAPVPTAADTAPMAALTERVRGVVRDYVRWGIL